VKRKLIVVSIIALLAAPGLAAAGIRVLKGPVDPSGSIRFQAKTNDMGHVLRIKGGDENGLHFYNVKTTCKDGNHKIDGHFDDLIPVSRREFSHSETYNGGGKVKVEGVFRHHGRRAHGTIKISGDFTQPNPNLKDCGGKRDWRAR